MEVTVKKLRKPAIVYIFCIAVCSSLIVGVASVAKCWRQKPPNFAFAGSCTLSKYFACSLWLLCLLSTHADEQGVDISVTVCLCVCVCVCTVTDFSSEDKASGVIFCTAVHRRPRQGISHFGELCSLSSPKSDESASARATPTRM